MNIHILTLFPELFPGSLGASLVGRSLGKQAHLQVHDLKPFADQIDDKPFGGGPGMIIKAQVIDDAIVKLKLEDTHKLFTCPKGTVFNQGLARSMLDIPQDLLFLCGRYEGVDQRVLDKWNFLPISIGNFVLCGGEAAVLVMLEAVIRLIPGVLGNQDSILNETHSEEGFIAHRQYTQPRVWQGRSVPEILVSGDHAKIRAYRSIDSLIE